LLTATLDEEDRDMLDARDDVMVSGLGYSIVNMTTL